VYPSDFGCGDPKHGDVLKRRVGYHGIYALGSQLDPVVRIDWDKVDIGAWFDVEADVVERCREQPPQGERRLGVGPRTYLEYPL
jgi:hypothetical protein